MKRIAIILLMLVSVSGCFRDAKSQNKRIPVNVITGLDSFQIGGRYMQLGDLSDSTKFDSVKYVSPKFTQNVNPFFATITQALNNAGSGTLIMVYPGTYDEQIKAKNNVKIYAFEGVNFTYTADNSNALCTDSAVAVNFSIRGFANFTRVSSDAQATILHTSNPDTKVFFEGVSLLSTVSGAGANWVLYNFGGEQYIKIDKLLTDGGINTRAVFNDNGGLQLVEVTDSIKTANGYAFYTTSGLQSIKANYILGGVRNASGSGTQIVNGNYIIATTNSFIWNAGTLQVINASIIDASIISQTAPITVTTGEVHITASVIKSDAYRYGSSLLGGFSGGIIYLKADVMYAPCTVIQNTGATLYADIKYLYNSNDTGHCVRQTAGTSYFNVTDMMGSNQPTGQGSYSTFNIIGGYANLHVTDSLIARGNGYACLEITGTGGLDVTANVIIADSGYACLLQGTGGGTVTANNIINKATDSGTVIDVNSASGTWTVKNAKITGRGTAIAGETFIVSLTTDNAIFWNCVFVNSDFLSGLDAYTFYSASNRDIRIYGIANGNVAIDNGVVIVTPVVGSFAVDAQVQ